MEHHVEKDSDNEQGHARLETVKDQIYKRQCVLRQLVARTKRKWQQLQRTSSHGRSGRHVPSRVLLELKLEDANV